MTRPFHAYLAETLAFPLLDIEGLMNGRVSVGADTVRARSTTLPIDTWLQDRGAGQHAHALRHLVLAAPDEALDAWLRRIASDNLRPDGDAVVLRASVGGLQHRLLYQAQRPGDARWADGTHQPGMAARILAWRWLSLAMPASILAVACDPRSQTLRVRLLGRPLAPQGPVAHLHLHDGATRDFEAVWRDVLREPDSKGRRKHPPRGITSADTWIDLLIGAALSRCSLTGPLERRRTLMEARDDAGTSDLWIRRYLGWFLEPGASRYVPSAMDRAYARAWLRGLPDEQDADEVRFLSLALHGSVDGEERRAALQVLRVKSLFFRVVVHDIGEVGLRNFTRAYARMRDLVKPTDPAREVPGLALAARADVLELAAIELRTSPESKLGPLLDLAAPCHRSTGRSRLEWAWGLHYLRSPSSDSWGNLRKWVQGKFEQPSRVVGDALRTWPELLHVIRYLDVASDEARGPLQLAAPFLEDVQRVSEEVAADHPHLGVRPLRLSLHVGEDFQHLLTGLRRVDEPNVWGLWRFGDRAGHALAAGLNVEVWAQVHPRVPVLLVDRVLDLSWALHAAESGSLDLGPVAVTWRRELVDLGAVLFGDHPSVDELLILHRTPVRRDTLLRAGLLGPDPVPYERDLSIRLYTEDVHRRWRQVVEVETRKELGAMVALQAHVLNRLAAHLIHVEVNPSSNLIIANLRHPVDQPLFQARHDHFRPPFPSMSLSADDPLSFATNLEDEHAYAWAGLVEAGWPPASAVEWLEELARQSMRARFTDARSKDLRDVRAPGWLERSWRSCGGGEG